MASCVQPVPLVKGGVADLSAWRFELQGLAHLDGQWELWWGRDVAALPSGPVEPALVQLPGYWNAPAGSPYPAVGQATYHLRVTLPSQGDWSIELPDVSGAWRLTVNQVVVATNGVPSMKPGEFRSTLRPRVVALPAGTSDADLWLYVVNLDNRVGGIRDSILLGPSEDLSRQYRRNQLGSAFTIGGIVVMALVNLVVFFLQRRRAANLWLAVFSVSIGVRTLFTGPRLSLELWPSLSFEVSVQVEYLCIFVAVAAFTFYLRNLFHDLWPSRVLVPSLLYTALFTVLVFLLPMKTYSEAFTDFYVVPLVVIIFVFLGITCWAALKKHQDGLIVFFGMLFLFSGALNDIVYQFFPLPQGYVLGPFLFIFLILNTFILSRQLAKDYNLTQKQSIELRKLDKMKDDFLARVTHELRTPLHGMVGILDAFRMGDFGSLADRQRYHLGLLEASSKRLVSMVNSILDFNNLKNHPESSTARPILLKQVVDFLLPAFYPDLTPGVALVNRLSDRLPAALGDEVRLEQVLHHVVRNALQHTRAGTISIEAEVKDHLILLTVRDTGTGIPAEKLAQVFTPFHQLEELDTRPTGGLGLGLAISRHLTLQMGGRLDVQSKEGVGTTVLIELPVCPPAKLQYFVAQRLDNRFQNAAPPVSVLEAPVPAAPADTAAPGPVVLIVDDEPVNRLVLRTFLNRVGYTIVEAGSGPQALECVQNQTVDLVILDIMMPGMSGYEVCAKLRESFSPARLPILLLTAKNGVQDLLQGYRCGASDFLTKPFQREELQARMELHLNVSKAARAGAAVANNA
jgi:two-component system sensor histidine kinase ChiS